METNNSPYSNSNQPQYSSYSRESKTPNDYTTTSTALSDKKPSNKIELNGISINAGHSTTYLPSQKSFTQDDKISVLIQKVEEMTARLKKVEDIIPQIEQIKSKLATTPVYILLPEDAYNSLKTFMKTTEESIAGIKNFIKGLPINTNSVQGSTQPTQSTYPTGPVIMENKTQFEEEVEKKKEKKADECLNFWWIYSDQKIYTDNTLMKLKNELVHSKLNINATGIEGISALPSCSGVVLFHYVAGGRDATDEINTRLTQIRKVLFNTPIYVVVLRDSSTASQQLKINTEILAASPQSFTICSDPTNTKGISLALYFDARPRSFPADRYLTVTQNGDNLRNCLKTLHNPRN